MSPPANVDDLLTWMVVRINALEQQVSELQVAMQRIAPAYYSDYKARHRTPEHRPDLLSD